MSLPAPRHVAQLTAGGQFPNGRPSGSYDCAVAVGIMALDAYSSGAIVPSATAFRAAQNDQAGGIGLDDVGVAWSHFGQRFDYGARTWSAIMARVNRGDGVAIEGSYIALGAWRAPGSKYTGGHALWLQRSSARGSVIVNDPLRSGPTSIPSSVLARFYLSGLALAGWGAGVYAGAPAPPPPGGIDPGKIIDDTILTPIDQGLLAPIGKGLDDLGKSIEAIPVAIGNAFAHIALLGGIVLLGLLGAWLTFRESGAIVVRA